MVKTLFLSDLDGTLLHTDQHTGQYTNDTLNELIARGCVFSYATARAFETASGATSGLFVCAPVAVHNGTMIVDPKTKKILSLADFSQEDAQNIVDAFAFEGLLPICYSVIDGKNRFSYCRKTCCAGQWKFLLTRLNGACGSERAREVFNREQLLSGQIFYFSCIAEYERLVSVHRRLKERFRCFLYRDRASGDWWLEVMRKDVSKASAALKIKELTGCDRLICFGDDVNDIPLFRIADACYALRNAISDLKEIATGVIASNDEDGVANWMKTHAMLNRNVETGDKR